MNKLIVSLMLSTLIIPQCLATDSEMDPDQMERSKKSIVSSFGEKEQELSLPNDNASTTSSSATSSRGEEEGNKEPSPLIPKEAVQELVENPDNYRTDGGFFGFGGTTRLDPEALIIKLEALLPSLEDSKAQARALREAQENADAQKELAEKYKAKVARKKRKLKIQQALCVQEEEEKKEVLSALTDKEGIVRVQSLREEALLKTIEEKDQIIKKLEEQAKLLEVLKKEKQQLESLLKTGGKDLVESVTEAIEKKEKKIQAFERKITSYEEEKSKKEQEIKGLRKSIKGHDYYRQIREMIVNKDLSDKDLSLKMFAIMNFLGMDLDELSKERERSLADLLIDVSIPYGPPPAEGVPQKYQGSWRLIGNEFLPKGETLVWKGGQPIGHVVYSASSFAQKSGEMKKEVMNNLTRKK